MPKNSIGEQTLGLLTSSHEDERKGRAQERSSRKERQFINTEIQENSVNTEIQEPRRIKATHELLEDTLNDLELAKTTLRVILKRRVSRYEIVEAALQILLEDLALNGNQSRLVKRL